MYLYAIFDMHAKIVQLGFNLALYHVAFEVTGAALTLRLHCIITALVLQWRRNGIGFALAFDGALPLH